MKDRNRRNRKGFDRPMMRTLRNRVSKMRLPFPGWTAVLLAALAAFCGNVAVGTASIPGKITSMKGSTVVLSMPATSGRIAGGRARGASSAPQAAILAEPPYFRYLSGAGVEGPAGPWETSASRDVATVSPVSVNAPFTLARSFAGLDLNNIFSLNGAGFIPPDTMGAAGPGHLVNIVNGGIAVFNKTTRTIDNQTSLQGFWSPLGTGPGQPANDVFDSKVIYDPLSGRFIVISIGGRSAPDSWILLAVSSTSNPNDLWALYAIDADQDADAVVRNNSADFPCLGVDAGHVYVTANMFDNTFQFQYIKAWAFQTSEVLVGATPLTVTEFRDPPNSGFTSQPAQVFGTSSAEYVASAGWFDLATGAQRFLRIASITFPGGVGTWSDLGFIHINGHSFTLPDAPQQGGGTPIDTGDIRMANLVYRSGRLFTTHTVTPSVVDNTRTEVAWYEIDPAAASTSVTTAGPPVQQGRISDPARFYFYPSIAVNANRDIVIGFSGSSPTGFASAYYSNRGGSDPAGTMSSPALLRAGQGSYVRIGSSGANRWGDYSATCLDPSADNTFWTIQEYVVSDNTWGTWWGAVTIGTIPSPLGSGGIFGPAGSSSSGGCTVARERTSPGGPMDVPSSAATLVAFISPAAVLALRKRYARRGR